MKRRTEKGVYFSWEGRRGWFGGALRARARVLFFVVLGVVVFGVLRHREENAAAVRSTRASITDAIRAVASYRADHAGTCPAELADLVTGGYMRDPPADAWGRPLRVACPGRHDHAGFDVSSDGPDGLPGGLDRVE
jgi:general secretion pathway protein G